MDYKFDLITVTYTGPDGSIEFISLAPAAPNWEVPDTIANVDLAEAPATPSKKRKTLAEISANTPTKQKAEKKKKKEKGKKDKREHWPSVGQQEVNDVKDDEICRLMAEWQVCAENDVNPKPKPEAKVDPKTKPKNDKRPIQCSICVSDKDIPVYKEFTGLKTTGVQTWIAVSGFDFSDEGPTHTTWSDLVSTAANRKSFIPSLKKLIDYHFKHWLKEHYPTLDPSTPTGRTDGGIQDDFASLRRTYNPGQKDWHQFSVTKQGSKDKPEDQISEFWLEDKHMNRFFGQATDSLIQNLDDHHDRAALKDWGIGTGIINTNIQAYRLLSGGFTSVEANPDTIIRGAVHGSYPGVEVVARSRAHYGYVLATRFQEGDPEWSRVEDPWDNTDRCEVYVSWHVRKNQLLDSHANITQDASQVLATNGRLRGQLNLYRCELDEPPRWARTHQDTPDPNMHFVGSVNFEFTEADFPGAEVKVCEDGIERRLFPVRIKVMCGNYTRTLRVTVTSPDGRYLGRASLRYE
ncbi:hypothetical protein IFR05_001317 [Cadophora sp. M221]|nr:hypothetical protein IFR05_001317 [Cadophora sp. M221]